MRRTPAAPSPGRVVSVTCVCVPDGCDNAVNCANTPAAVTDGAVRERAGRRGQTVAMRELVVLGTSSQVPTRARNHNGYFLRWDGDGLLFNRKSTRLNSSH